MKWWLAQNILDILRRPFAELVQLFNIGISEVFMMSHL